MKKAFLESERLILRPFEAEDLTGPYRGWLNDHEVISHLASGTWPQSDDALRAYYERNLADSSNVMFMIVEKETEKDIGTARVYAINWVHRNARRGIMIGQKDCWGKGYGLEVINLISRYAFESLNLHKLTSETVGDNIAVHRVNEKAGYQREGVKRENFFRNGEWHDVICFGLLQSEWRDAQKSK